MMTAIGIDCTSASYLGSGLGRKQVFVHVWHADISKMHFGKRNTWIMIYEHALIYGEIPHFWYACIQRHFFTSSTYNAQLRNPVAYWIPRHIWDWIPQHFQYSTSFWPFLWVDYTFLWLWAVKFWSWQARVSPLLWVTVMYM